MFYRGFILLYLFHWVINWFRKKTHHFNVGTLKITQPSVKWDLENLSRRNPVSCRKPRFCEGGEEFESRWRKRFARWSEDWTRFVFWGKAVLIWVNAFLSKAESLLSQILTKNNCCTSFSVLGEKPTRQVCVTDASLMSVTRFTNDQVICE